MNHRVVVPENKWEFSYHPEDEGVGKRIYVYGTVFYDPIIEKYRMWYMSRLARRHELEIPGLELPGENIHGDLTLYAESEDGVHWVKPDLGIYKVNGDPNNNIVMDFHGASVILDMEEEDPQKRYKAIGFVRRFHEIRVCYSPDGIHWSEPMHATDRYNEGALNACYVPHLGYYVAGSIERSENPRFSFENFHGDVRGKRVCPAMITEGRDEFKWVGRKIIYPNIIDSPDTQFYGMCPFSYGNNDMVFGFLHVFEYTGPGPANDDGPVEAHLIYSRDGLNWHRLEDRQPIIPVGPEGSFDDGMIMMTANGTFLHDNKIYTYYTAANTGHGALIKDRDFGIAIATWGKDRLVALEAGSTEGVVETVVLKVPDGTVPIVNADARGGYLVAEVLDERGQVQPGFSSENCVVMHSDDLDYELKWKEKKFSEAKKPLCLRFKVKDAKLFSVRFDESK